MEIKHMFPVFNICCFLFVHSLFFLNLSFNSWTSVMTAFLYIMLCSTYFIYFFFSSRGGNLCLTSTFLLFLRLCYMPTVKKISFLIFFPFKATFFVHLPIHVCVFPEKYISCFKCALETHFYLNRFWFFFRLVSFLFIYSLL